MRWRLILSLGVLGVVIIIAFVAHVGLFSHFASREDSSKAFVKESDKSHARTSALARAGTEHAPPEEPARLTEARNDPDPRVRLNALEAWARDSHESFDPITHALVDPDEEVRARAQELFEEQGGTKERRESEDQEIDPQVD